MELEVFLSFSIAALLSLVLTPLIGKLAVLLGAIDPPGHRKIHQIEIPRMGGLSVFLSIALTIFLAASLSEPIRHALFENRYNLIPLTLGSLVVFFIGLWDDVYNASRTLKFTMQTVAALIAISFGIRFGQLTFFDGTTIDIGLWAYPLSFIWIIGITNAFNLIDGLDGLSAGLASIAAGTSAVVFFLRGDLLGAVILFIVLGALLGFLRYNFFPATIFLGDSGSLFVGYILATTAITGSQKGVTTFAIIFPLLIFGLPIADTLLSMIRRYLGALRLLRPYKISIEQKLKTAESMFRPDSGHIHHRLLVFGFSHRNAVLFLYCLSLALAGLALLTVISHGRNTGLVLILVGLASYVGISKLGYNEIQIIRPSSLLSLYERMGLRRRFFLGFLDIILISTAYWISFYMKYEPNGTFETLAWYQSVFPFALVIQFGFFYIFGLYNSFWKALNAGDLLRITFSSIAGILSWGILVFISLPPQGIIGFLFIYCFLMLVLIVSSRSTYSILDYLKSGEKELPGRPVLIYGAGKAGQLTLREILQNSELGLSPIGFIDDDPNFANCTISRFPILGTCVDAKSILSRDPSTALVIASSKIMQERLKEILDFCKERQIFVYWSFIKVNRVDLENSDALEAIGNLEPGTEKTKISQLNIAAESLHSEDLGPSGNLN